MESLSPKLMLSSELAVGSSGRETPISSADSRRVETDERRWWWEVGRLGGRLRDAEGESGTVGGRAGAEEERGKEEMELLRERDRRWECLAKVWRLWGGAPPPILND